MVIELTISVALRQGGFKLVYDSLKHSFSQNIVTEFPRCVSSSQETGDVDMKALSFSVSRIMYVCNVREINLSLPAEKNKV